MEKNRKTLYINLFGGPGAGKTTCAWEIGAELKKQGLITEYVPEFAKELVWAKRFDLLADQQKVTDTQYSRLKLLNGQVDYVVTDSPVLLGQVYGADKISDDYSRKITRYHNSLENFNLFIKRGTYFEKAGRIQDEAAAKQKDKEIFDVLGANKVFYGIYRHEDIKTIITNIKTTFKRINTVTENDDLER